MNANEEKATHITVGPRQCLHELRVRDDRFCFFYLFFSIVIAATAVVDVAAVVAVRATLMCAIRSVLHLIEIVSLNNRCCSRFNE